MCLSLVHRNSYSLTDSTLLCDIIVPSSLHISQHLLCLHQNSFFAVLIVHMLQVNSTGKVRCHTRLCHCKCQLDGCCLQHQDICIKIFIINQYVHGNLHQKKKYQSDCIEDMVTFTASAKINFTKINVSIIQKRLSLVKVLSSESFHVCGMHKS